MVGNRNWCVSRKFRGNRGDQFWLAVHPVPLLELRKRPVVIGSLQRLPDHHVPAAVLLRSDTVHRVSDDHRLRANYSSRKIRPQASGLVVQ